MAQNNRNELTYQSEFTGQQMDQRFAAVAELTAALEALTAVVAGKYVKPADGIPSSDMTAAVQASLAKAESAVQSLADYYTKTEVDQLLAAINGMDYVDVSTLPTASASTMGKIYLVGPDASGYYSYYYTSYNGSAYSWVGPLGTTQISLANYATKTELNQLDQEVDEIGINFSPASVISNNILAPALIIADTGYIRRTDGVTIQSGYYGYTDFIELGPEGLAMNNALPSAGAYAGPTMLYDASKNFVQRHTSNIVDPQDVPNTVKYVRFNLGDPSVFAEGGSLEGQDYAVNRATSVLPYDAYTFGRKFKPEAIPAQSITTAQIQDGAVIPKKMSFKFYRTDVGVSDIIQAYEQGLLDCYIDKRLLPVTSFGLKSYGGSIRIDYKTTGDVVSLPAIPLDSIADGEKIDIVAGDVTVGYFAMRDKKQFVDNPTGGNTSLNIDYITSPNIRPVAGHVLAGTIGTPQVKDGSITQEKLAASIKAAPTTFGSLRDSDTIAAGESLLLSTVHIAKNMRMVASIDGSITSVFVGVAKGGFYGKWIEVTPTTIKVIYGEENTVLNTYEHGLTLGTKTTLIIAQTMAADGTLSASARLINDYGDTYSTSINWGVKIGQPFVYNNQSASVKVDFSFFAGDINKSVWLFGDSYMSFNDAARWVYHLRTMGFTNWLLNARGGESAPQALDDFIVLTALGARPSFAVWGLGMNGGTDSSDDVNSTWQTATEQFLTLCTSYGITPILCTIPTIPTASHVALNAWVAASGCRYIDFAKAVEAEGTDYWRGWGTDNALLSSDAIHPTERGAVELARQALQDFPELTLS